MMGGKAPHGGAAPIVAHPHGLVAAERVEKLQHVGNDLALRVVGMLAIDAGAAIAAHVRRDSPEAEAAHDRQLVAPAERQLRPAVHEDDERSVLGARREIERRVAGGLRGVFSDGGHGGKA
jgi:hypothetical protein